MSSPHDPTTPDTIYHVVQLSVWNKVSALTRPQRSLGRTRHCFEKLVVSARLPSHERFTNTRSLITRTPVRPQAKATGGDYFPPTYADDGFIHATHEAKLLLDVLNHFYKEVKVCTRGPHKDTNCNRVKLRRAAVGT